MAAISYKPNKGEVTKPPGFLSPLTAKQRQSLSNAGLWRPSTGFDADVGLRMTMRAVRGITDPAVLRVPFRFQVPPIGDFQRTYGFDWAKFNTIARGEQARPMGSKLLDLSIDTMLLDGPAQDDAMGFVIWEGAPEPQRLLRELRFIMGDYPGGKATPFRLTIAQPSVWNHGPLVSVVSVLTGVVSTIKANEIGTDYITVSFLELDAEEVDRHKQPKEQDQKRTHKVALGKDSLYEIAKRYYRSASDWRLIATANGITGVSPDAEKELEKWMEKHHRKELKIPPKPQEKKRG